MLEGIGSSIVGLLVEILGREPVQLASVPLISWQEASIFSLPTEPDPLVEAMVEQYLQSLSERGFVRDSQGVWIGSDWTALAQYQGTVPISAASLTKIATTLAAIAKWDVEHQFETQIYADGEINAGVLQGDLVIQGDGDPFFVWEEAIAVGNALNELGIRQVAGNLVVSGDFFMNYRSDSAEAGQLLRYGLDSRLWTPVIANQYRTMPAGTPRPQVAIAGSVVETNSLPTTARLLLRHHSLPLAQILKQMNIYSNNKMAEMLAQAVGGATAVARIAAITAEVPPAEIQLINGSGLGVDNRISPRAASKMLVAIARRLESEPIGVADLFPVAGRDDSGTIADRNLPNGTAIKTGTLNQVSALAGAIPTSDGPIWFAIINSGSDILELRAAQDRLLQNLSQYLKVAPFSTQGDNGFLGDPQRNLKVEG